MPLRERSVGRDQARGTCHVLVVVERHLELKASEALLCVIIFERCTNRARQMSCADVN